MVPASLIAYYISNKFKIEEGKLGTIMASAQFISSIGNIFASSAAKRIGLVKTSEYPFVRLTFCKSGKPETNGSLTFAFFEILTLR